MPFSLPTAPRSRHFDLQAVADGAYAALATEAGWAVSNAGIVDLGDQTIVFDTFSNHLAAEDLRRTAEAVTGRRAGAVVNSHVHRDHVKGNQVFGDAAIVATRKTAEAMTQRWKLRTERVRSEGLDPLKKGIQEEFETWESNPLTTAADRIPWEGYREALLQGIESYAQGLPTVSFETSLDFPGSKGSAEAVTFGGGHSASDALLHLPDRRVAYLGDLLFIGFQPFLGDGNVEEYLRILDRIEALDARTLVPGHGPVGTARDLQTMRDYVDAVRKACDEPRTGHADPKKILVTPIPAPFQSLKWRAFWRENLDFVLRMNATPGGK